MTVIIHQREGGFVRLEEITKIEKPDVSGSGKIPLTNLYRGKELVHQVCLYIRIEVI